VIEVEERPGWSGQAVATIHPSAVLRAEDRDEAFDGLVSDLLVVAELLDGGA
jgi:DNA polymerase